MKSLLFITVLTVASFPNAQSWKSISNDYFEINYPDTWDLNNTGGQASIILLSKQESAADMFRENVNLIEQDITGMGMDLTRYAKLSEQQIIQLIPNSKILVNRLDGDHHVMEYLGDQSNYKLRFIQYYWLKGNKAYILTFTAEQTKFDQYKDMGIKILNSFVLK